MHKQVVTALYAVIPLVL